MRETVEKDRRKISAIFARKKRFTGKPRSEWASQRFLSALCIRFRYVFFFRLIEPAIQRFEGLPANSSEASLLLNSATSAANTYLLFAIKCVRIQPRFS